MASMHVLGAVVVTTLAGLQSCKSSRPSSGEEPIGIVASDAESNTQIFRCQGKDGGETNIVRIKVGSAGILPWSSSKYAEVESGSLLAVLGEPRVDNEIVYTRSFVAPNGFSMLELGNVDDVIKFGISKDGEFGFFETKEAGAARSDARLQLVCHGAT